MQQRPRENLNPPFVVCGLVPIILIGRGSLCKGDYMPTPKRSTPAMEMHGNAVTGYGQWWDTGRRAQCGPTAVHLTELQFGVFFFFHWQTDWNLIPWQNVEAEFFCSHFPSCPCTKLDFTKRLRVRKTNMWVCSPCGVEVHSSGRIAVSSLKIRPRPLGLSQYSKWFQSLFKSCRRERSPGEICSTMMIQSVYTEEWKKKKKKEI